MAVGWWIAALIGGGLLAADHWFNWMPPYAGWFVSAIALFGFLRGVSLLISRKLDLRTTAREIETKHPELNTILQSATEQEPDQRTGELHYLQQRVIDRASEIFRSHRWSRQAHNRLSLMRALNQLGALALLVVLALLFKAEPTVKFSAPTLAVVRDIEVVPGDAEVERGTSLIVMAKFPKEGPREVTLVIYPSDGQPNRLAMNRNLDDPVFGAQIPAISNDLLYQVEYEDGKTAQFKVTVFEYPRLVRGDATLNFPQYTGLTPKLIEDTRRINAVEGTKLNYQLTLNKPVAKAQLWSTNGTELVLTPDAQSSNVFNVSGTLLISEKYYLTLVDADGRTNRVPDEISISVLANEAPALKLTSPRGDQRFSPLEEVRFESELSDDFGLVRYGLAYSINGSDTTMLELGQTAGRFEKRSGEYLLMLEDLKVKTDDLVSYYLWAEDYGPDGSARLNEGDMFFGEIRPLDEIYREGQQTDAGPPGQQEESPATKLLKLQKEIMSATWNVKRFERSETPSKGYAENVVVIQESQEVAITEAEEAGGQMRDAKMKLFLQQATAAMKDASAVLTLAADGPELEPLSDAMSAEKIAYANLLRLQAREFEVSRSKGGGGGGGGNRSQQQLDQLELAQEEDRYETERQATSPQISSEQSEDLQVLSRLKDLARRQDDLNERLQELQTALLAADNEKEKEELRRELKRLQEQQQQLVNELDEVNQRMANQENQSRMAESRKELEKTRDEMQKAAEKLEEGEVSSALASGTRAQQELQQMREDFRQRSSNEFNEQMRDLRETARDLAKKEGELQEQFKSLTGSEQKKSLSDSPLKEALSKELSSQQETLTNLLQNIRQVSDQAEIAEPLLSRQLYETYRDANRGQQTRDALPRMLQQAYDSLKSDDESDLEATYQLSSQLLESGYAPYAQEVQKLAEKRVQKLKDDVENAAESILGDDLQALRQAGRELENLTRELGRDLAANNSGQQPGQQSEQQGQGQQGQGEQGQGQQGQGQQGQGQQGQGEQGQGEQGQGEQGQGEQGQGEQGQGEQGQGEQGQGQQGQGQQGQGQQGQGQQGQGQQGQGQQGQGEQGQGGQSGEGQGGGQQQGSSLIQAARNNSQQERGGGGGGGSGGGGPEDQPGIFTGEGYSQWTDQLRNVEEMIDDQELRQELATVRDLARDVRIDFKRNSKPPQWDMVQTKILRPLEAIREKVREELQRRQDPDSLIAIDRDPVPGRYSELVRSYYEKLGSDN